MWRWVRASSCCASNSLKMACSVKFFEPMTMVSRRAGPHENRAIAAHRKTAIHRVLFIPIRVSSSSRETEAALEKTEQEIGCERQESCWDCASENQLIIDHGQAAKDEFAESACADGCGDCGDADGQHGGYADA